MSRWFRFYDDVINDPKVLCLPEAMRWSWVAVLCAASKNDGNLPELEHLALMLRVTSQRTASILTELCKAGLLDKTETGFEPHNWNGRQYKSDVSTERVKRFRKGKGNVTCNFDETFQKRPQIQTTDTEQKDIPPAASRDEEFEEFWKAYPKRDGANPKEPAAKLFRAAIKAGAFASDIIAGVKRCAEVESKNVGTPYIPQAVKWLRDKRWMDYQESSLTPEKSPELEIESAVKMFSKTRHWSKWAGPEPGVSGCKASPELLGKYGLMVDGRKLENSGIMAQTPLG